MQRSHKNIQDIINQKKKERASKSRQDKEDAERRQRLRALDTTLTTLWEHQWEFVQLTNLPGDVPPGVGVRESDLADELARLLKLYFAELFDIYLFYSKVDGDGMGSELYKMLDFNWKTCLKEAGVVADGKSETLTTSDSTRIFKQVNQQRDNMEQAKGNQASKSQAAEYTQAAMKAMVESGGEPARGFGASVTKSHHAAGSLYAFTFSEFLEGLIIAAIECANGTNPPPREGLSKAAVLTAVRRLLEERVLLRCQRGDVLDFRYTMANSAPLGDALDSIRHLIDPLYDKYADMPTKIGLMGFSLKSFLEVCQEAQLVGAQLSHVTVKNIFVNSLLITADSDASRKPLLSRHEFQEAICRLAYKYDAAKDTDLGGTAGGTPVGALNQAAKKTKAELQKRRLAHAATLNKATLQATLAKAAAGDEDGGEEEETATVESIVLGNLPIVGGKLLALLETVNI